MILSIPWLIISVILYNLIAFTSGWPEVDPATGKLVAGTVFHSELFSIGMISGAYWALTLGDLMVLITLAILFVELIKATRTGETSIVDHALSMILFIFCVVEFLVVRQAATSVFFIITAVTLIDVVAGFTITIRAARRDFTMGATH
jgi:hypothetical protein